MNCPIHLILGGARSGKSAYAEKIAAASHRPVVCLTTCATAFADPEMRLRIQRHRQIRPSDWITIENHFHWESLFIEHQGRTVLADCLTLWLSFHSVSTEVFGEKHLFARLEKALCAARENRIHLVLVSNELGMGLVPSSPLGRAFRDLSGRANQRAAAQADTVDFLIAGLPLRLKGPPIPQVS
jgi:adenosylcobinamide kinase/adenosylcobinamide-phosphate guanylyltransferase